MREFWVTLHGSPILYRYIDWSITVPLQMIEFYLILSAVNPDLGVGMFWRLFIGTVAMLAAGYAGESQLIAPMLGFQVGMAGWVFILFEVFVMARGSVAEANKFVQDGCHCHCRVVYLPCGLLFWLPARGSLKPVLEP